MSYVPRRGAAYSLLEVLVVLAIMVVMILLLIPLFSSARETAQLTGCAAQLSQLGRGTAAYAVGFRGYLPIAADLDQNSGVIIYQGQDGSYKLYGPLLDGDYIGNKGELFMCPNREDDKKSNLFSRSGKPRWGKSFGGSLWADYAQKSVKSGVPAKIADASTATLMTDITSNVVTNHEEKMNMLKGDGSVEMFDWASTKAQ